MWIAYKIYYLCDRKQQIQSNAQNIQSCELLTKFIIFAIGNNFHIFVWKYNRVVNCLQNLLSLRSETTTAIIITTFPLLWIAYKIYYLCDRKQLRGRTGYHLSCCELLTKFIIFAIGNNITENASIPLSVVNCLQNLLSLRSETTLRFNETQSVSCELLTKFIIFAIGNNLLSFYL